MVLEMTYQQLERAVNPTHDIKLFAGRSNPALAQEIADYLGIDKEKITMDSRLAEDLGADSLDAVELIMTLEDEFGIEVDDEAATKIKKVSDIVEFLEK